MITELRAAGIGSDVSSNIARSASNVEDNYMRLADLIKKETAEREPYVQPTTDARDQYRELEGLNMLARNWLCSMEPARAVFASQF
eukprot:9984219-Alexandrium_andersonii.AAC.1